MNDKQFKLIALGTDSDVVLRAIFALLMRPIPFDAFNDWRNTPFLSF
jgi:hypothetical protein